MRLLRRPENANLPKKVSKPSRAKSIRSFTLEEDMFKQAILAGALALTASTAMAQEVKVGVALPFTGIGAEFAQLIDRGMEQYLKLNADKVRPYKITLVKRDVKDPGGANARTQGQRAELAQAAEPGAAEPNRAGGDAGRPAGLRPPSRLQGASRGLRRAGAGDHGCRGHDGHDGG